MYGTTPEITKAYIEKYVTHEEIFEYYTGQRVGDEMITSTLRNDRRPTCKYSWYKGVLTLTDFSGDFRGDCYNYVMRYESCSFKEALEHIATVFKLVDGRTRRKKKLTYTPKEQTPTVIKVVWRKLTKRDIDYWSSFGVTVEQLKLFNVAPISHAVIDGALRYTHKDNDPCYAYWFSETEIKLYFPMRSEFRFLGNARCLQGYNQLPEKGDLLIVTKSYKDVMLLRRLGYYAVAPQTEAAILSQEHFNELSTRFERIVTFYDCDRAGLRGAIKARRTYGTKAIFLTNGALGSKNYGAKDITDYYKKTNYEQCQSVMKELTTVHCTM